MPGQDKRFLSLSQPAALPTTLRLDKTCLKSPCASRASVHGTGEAS